MIKFRDFLPAKTKAAGIFSVASYASLDTVLKDVNAWVEKTNVDVINVETILEPAGPGYSNDSLIKAETSTQFGGGQEGYWCQFIRVWYREKPEN